MNWVNMNDEIMRTNFMCSNAVFPKIVKARGTVRLKVWILLDNVHKRDNKMTKYCQIIKRQQTKKRCLVSAGNFWMSYPATYSNPRRQPRELTTVRELKQSPRSAVVYRVDDCVSTSVTFSFEPHSVELQRSVLFL